MNELTPEEEKSELSDEEEKPKLPDYAVINNNFGLVLLTEDGEYEIH